MKTSYIVFPNLLSSYFMGIPDTSVEKNNSRCLNYSGNCFIFRCNTGYLVKEVLWKMFFPIFVLCPLIINSSYRWSRNVNRNKTLAKLGCQLSNFLEVIETSSSLWREKPAPDAASHVAILSVSKSATQHLASWLWWGICMLKTRLKICCSDLAWIYRDLVAVRRGEEGGNGWLRKL